MKIRDLLSEKTIAIDVESSSKEDIIHQAVTLIGNSGNILDLETYEAGVKKRELESTTGIGEGIAIPHCKSKVVAKPTLAAITIKGGVDYDALDGEKVELLFLIAAPDSEDNVHLDVLARLSEMLMDESFKNNLLAAKTKEDFLKVIDEAEAIKIEEKEAEANADSGFPKVLAVTGCPTGIAHTYMAEQSLKDKAAEMGISIKVETNGSGGVKNLLTDEEIEHAEGIIIAADINVEMDRFANKRLVKAAVAKGIHEPERLINEALDPATPIYKAGEVATKHEDAGKESIFRQFYKHLMSGISHMLPFIIGGGILTAIALLVDTMCGNAGADNFGHVNAVADIFKTIGEVGMGSLMLAVFAGFIAYSIAGRPGLAVGMVGGYLASTNYFNIKYTISVIINGMDSDAYFAISENTVSPGFIGALIAGFLAGYIIKLLEKAFAFMPKSLDSLKPTLVYPVFGLLLIGVAMWLINTPLIYLSVAMMNGLNWLNESGLILLVCALLAAMMAIDMGGPINKAAYVFGTYMLSQAASILANNSAADVSANYMIMASVMIGGMVPPLAIALSTILFPQKYNKKERKDGYVNFVMGASFVTEGAIPYVAADPWRVILSCAIGSGVAGLLSGVWGCTLSAPHGGIFVIAIIGNWYFYLLAILIGTLVATLLLGILKKDHPNPELGKWKGIRFTRSKPTKTKEENN